MILVLEIEHLLGVSFAARTPASTEPDWPPQADRVFSALVSAWAARGERADERRALEWLEAQPAPEITASGGFNRSAATAFVPPNDPASGRTGDRSLMPASRRRQPRRFPAFRPDDPVVHLIWREPNGAVDALDSLNALAGDVPYIGHSASLTRCRFRTDLIPGRARRSLRSVYPGRLAELEREYKAGRRPGPGPSMPRDEVPPDASPRSTFADRVLVLQHVGGDVPDLRATALVGKAIRDALMSGYRQTVGEAAVPDVVSGHAPDGSPLGRQHLAVVPLAFLGTRYADGHVLGFAVVPPAGSPLLDDPAFRNALKKVAPWNVENGRRELTIAAKGFNFVVTPSPDRSLRSLDSSPYVATARTWATCTPIVLDRHLKEKGNAARDREARDLVGRACRNIGLPLPARRDGRDDDLAVSVGKHAAVLGAPSAHPSGRAPSWTGWRLPTSLASRPLVHAVIRFEEPVRGPVVLGAGRFAGMGLCRALDAEEHE